MLTFDQCLNIRDAGACIKDIAKKARYRKLAMWELEDLYYQLARIETWLNRHPTWSERQYAKLYKLYRRVRHDKNK